MVHMSCREQRVHVLLTRPRTRLVNGPIGRSVDLVRPDPKSRAEPNQSPLLLPPALPPTARRRHGGGGRRPVRRGAACAPGQQVRTPSAAASPLPPPAKVPHSPFSVPCAQIHRWHIVRGLERVVSFQLFSYSCSSSCLYRVSSYVPLASGR
jgi:hypothetical protein